VSLASILQLHYLSSVKPGCLRKSPGGNGHYILYRFALYYLYSAVVLTRYAEDVPKGSNDRPLEDVTIYDSGEVCFYVYLPVLGPACSSHVSSCQLSRLLMREEKRYPYALSYDSAASVSFELLMRIKYCCLPTGHRHRTREFCNSAKRC
jgi:hypothetical protein